MKRTTVKLPDEVDARLRKEAELRGTTLSALVRESIEEHLGVRPRQTPRLSFAGLFESGYTDTAERAEEILAEIYEKRWREREEERDRRRRLERPVRVRRRK